jgi:Zn-dependent protease with chaperone function
MSTDVAAPPPDIRVTPWPWEAPLFVLAVLVSAAMWIVLAVSIIGIIYVLAIGLVLFALQVGFVAHVRGSALRVGPDQYPDIYAAVERLSHRIGINPVPETYLMQSGGTLNALATHFLRSNMIVLFTELLEACGDDTGARDMIVAHEVGHIRRGHVRWQFAIAPAMFIPFLSQALSRAREYTCDRYGVAGAGSRDAAVLGMMILAGGPRYGRRADRAVFARQAVQLNTGWMTLGYWLASHPPLVHRIAQIDPALHDPSIQSTRGAVRAVGILAAVLTPFVVGGIAAAILVPMWAARQTKRGAQSEEAASSVPSTAAGLRQAKKDFAVLAAFIREERLAGRDMPWDTGELYDRWNASHHGAEEPLDPFGGERYPFQSKGEAFRLWCIGPDREWSTDDDVMYDSRKADATSHAPSSKEGAS